MILRILLLFLTVFFAVDCFAQVIPNPVTAKGLIEYYEHKMLAVTAESSSLSSEELREDLADRLKGKVLSVSNFDVLKNGEGSKITLHYAMSKINELQSSDKDDDRQRLEIFSNSKEDKALAFLIEKPTKKMPRSVYLAFKEKKALKFNEWSLVADEPEVLNFIIENNLQFEVPKAKVAEFIEKKEIAVSQLFKVLKIPTATPILDSVFCKDRFDDYLSELESNNRLLIVETDKTKISEKVTKACEDTDTASSDFNVGTDLFPILLAILLILATLAWYLLNLRKKTMSQTKEEDPLEDSTIAAHFESPQSTFKEELDREVANHLETKRKLEAAEHRAATAEQALHQLREVRTADPTQADTVAAVAASAPLNEKFYAPWVRGRQGFLAGDLQKGKNGKSVDFYVIELLDDINGRLLINEAPKAQMRAVQSANTVMNIASAPINLPNQAKTGIKMITAGKVRLSPDKKEWIVTEPVKIKYV